MRFGKKVGSHIQALFNSTKPNIMTNKEKAYEISERYATSDYFPTDEEISAYEAAMEMAEWKDQRINLLLDAIDHAYLQLGGSYGDLALEVVDKVEYLKSLRQ